MCWTATRPGNNNGDAIRAGVQAGAAGARMEHTWGVPTMDVPGEDKLRGIFVERSLPGGMVGNASGGRCTNGCPSMSWPASCREASSTRPTTGMRR